MLGSQVAQVCEQLSKLWRQIDRRPEMDQRNL